MRHIVWKIRASSGKSSFGPIKLIKYSFTLSALKTSFFTQWHLMNNSNQFTDKQVINFFNSLSLY